MCIFWQLLKFPHFWSCEKNSCSKKSFTNFPITPKCSCCSQFHINDGTLKPWILDRPFKNVSCGGGGGCFSVNYVFSYALIQVTEPPSSYTRYFAVQLIVMFSFESACDEVIMTKYGDLASGCQDCIRSLGGSIPYSLFQFMAFLTYFWLALLPFAS